MAVPHATPTVTDLELAAWCLLFLMLAMAAVFATSGRRWK